MKRDLKKLSATKYDILVIGGGITGAAIAWDAALRGLKVALLEKKDFGHATSSATSKLIHGGLRYLKNLEFSLVRESLRERRYMQRISPHMVYPYGMLIPTYGWGKRGPLYLGLGLFVYSLLSYDRNRLPKGFAKIPWFKFASKKKVLQKKLGIQTKGLSGGIVYYDCQLFKPEKHTLEFVRSAEHLGAAVANYAEVETFQRDANCIKGVVVKDTLSNRKYKLEAEMVINASGPWADLVLNLAMKNQNHHLIRSKGIHIITRQLFKGQGLTLQLANGRHIFALPWRDFTLFGTTDTEYNGSPDDFRVTRKDVEDFLAEINSAFDYNLSLDDVLHYYGGMRPLVDDSTETGGVYQASRKYEIVDHTAENNIDGFITVEGGKYTTSRGLAETVVDLSLKKMGREPLECHTASTPLLTGDMPNFSTLLKEMRTRFAAFGVPLVDYLCHMYGNQARIILEAAEKNKSLAKPLQEPHLDIMAQVDFALSHEMAETLTDMFVRRLGMGNLGSPEQKTITTVAKFMAKRLKWSAARVKKEIASLKKRYQLK